MKRIIFVLGFAVLVGASFLAGSWYQGLKDVGAIASTHGPTISLPDEEPGSENDLPPGSVRIGSERQQAVGVRTAVVEASSGEHRIRAIGRIVPDEKRVYRLTAGADGWIRETFVNDTGTLVKKDDRLASFYNPQFRAAQLAYLATLSPPEDHRYQQTGRPALAPSQQANVTLQTYIDALESLGMSEKQMKELAAGKQMTDRVYILAPATGYVLARNVSPGQRYDKGFEWYQIANLDRVWVLADLFPNDAGDVKAGMKARVTVPNQGHEFQATITKIMPQADPTSRTLKVRLELDNPGHVLRPDMYVDVEFPINRPPAITVTPDAVLDSGLHKIVFVDHGDGWFEPREVKTGRRHAGKVEIVKGLEPGERIVVSGSFLIDSESKLALAAAGMQRVLEKDPVCGQEVSARKAERTGMKAVHSGTTYYFCSDDHRSRFVDGPEQYAGKGN